jgi:protein ImuB
VLVAWYPDWPVVAAGCPPGLPAAVIRANRVVAATWAARAEGVSTGQRRREAQSRCPRLTIVAADAGREARAWEVGVAAVESLTPGVEVVAPGTLSLATRGPSRYFGGDEALATLVADAVDRSVGQPGCRVGVADGHFAAGLAARARHLDETGGLIRVPPAGAGGVIRVPPAGAGGVIRVVARGASATWLAPQPVSVLGIEFEDLAGLLSRLGIRTLGDLARLPAASVLGRFGPLGAAAHRLARGRDDRPVAARTPPPELAVTAELDPPAERVDTAAFVAKALADELHGRLEARGLACTMVAIEAETEHGERLVRRWRHEGMLTAPALAERARWQLDGWLAGGAGAPGGPTAGLTLLRFTPEEVRPDHGRQLGFWGGAADADARAARAFARVQGLLGPEGVVTAVLTGGRGPADQVRLVPWGDERHPGPPVPESQVAVQVPESQVMETRSVQAQPVKRSRRRPPRPIDAPPWPGRLVSPSPAVVHHIRPPAQIRDDRGEVVTVSGRGVLSAAPAVVSVAGGPWAEVTAWAGPWPLEERWWDEGGRRQARLQILLDSGLSNELSHGPAHLLTREGGEWWVEATYD